MLTSGHQIGMLHSLLCIICGMSYQFRNKMFQTRYLST